VSHPAQRPTRPVAQFAKALGTEIGYLMVLPATSQVFDRIQFRRIGGKPFDFQPFPVFGHEVFHQLAAMRRQAIPDHQQLAGPLSQQMLQELHDLGTSDGARKQTEVEIPPCHSGDRRKRVPVEVVLQHGRLPLRRPRPAAMRPLAQPAFPGFLSPEHADRALGLYLLGAENVYLETLIIFQHEWLTAPCKGRVLQRDGNMSKPEETVRRARTFKEAPCQTP